MTMTMTVEQLKVKLIADGWKTKVIQENMDLVNDTLSYTDGMRIAVYSNTANGNMNIRYDKPRPVVDGNGNTVCRVESDFLKIFEILYDMKQRKQQHIGSSTFGFNDLVHWQDNFPRVKQK